MSNLSLFEIMLIPKLFEYTKIKSTYSNIFLRILIMLKNGWYFAELRPKLLKTVNFS